MTTMTLPNRPAPARSGKLKTGLRFFSALFEGVAEGREMARRYDALSRMTNAELARRGLSRETIPQAVVGGRRGV